MLSFTYNGPSMVALIVILTVNFAYGQRLNRVFQQDSGFGFPSEAEEDLGKRNDKNKVPVFIPNRCGENELLYPGDYKDDWVCDCRPGHIYHPNTSRCYSPFRQGPCQQKSFLYLPSGQYIPQCVANVCGRDGFVMFDGNCHQLGLAGPCQFPELSNVLAVNETTLQLQCITNEPRLVLNSRFDDYDDKITLPVEPVNLCPVGSKRWLNQTCT